MRYVRGPDAITVAKGNNTYQIVYTGNSDVAMDGAGVMYVYYADGTKRYDCIFTRVD
jgi:hypothetical protein